MPLSEAGIMPVKLDGVDTLPNTVYEPPGHSVDD
jgi:hypothetical protein